MRAISYLKTVAFVAFALTTFSGGPGGFRSQASVPANLAQPAETELRVPLGAIAIDRTTGNRTHNGLPFTGIAFQFYPAGQLAATEAFQNGRRHGELKKWFANGRMAFSSNYEFGRREGITQSWWENGNKRSQTLYINDQPDGGAWRWYRGGEIFKAHNYAAGVPVGLQRAWRVNGKLYSNFEIRNGRAYGLRNSNMCVELDNEEISIES